ncbi:MAG: hypothetical protein HYY52_03865 [Candidatus Melainabacteria bacterium]|nr:hypothetical protein [Candidatus Melainabacteria bacterium]
MPPRTLNRRPQARSKGSDPTISVAAASTAKVTLATNNPEIENKQANQNQGQNDDLKKLIETLKNKLGSTQGTPIQKQTPPPPKARTVWNRSITTEKTWVPKPAYTILTRVSNHEKVPVKSSKISDLSINSLPHSFLYRPGAAGIKVDKLTVKSGKQIGWG